MTITDDFNNNQYVILKEVFDSALCKKACEHLFELADNSKTIKDHQCPSSDAIYGDPFFDKLLADLIPVISDVSGVEVFPTYSYARIYRKGESLAIHRDRPACEISATLTLGFEGDPWEIFFNKENSDKSDNGIILDVGSAAIYKGTEIYHWRNEFEGKWQCQVFFHYVNANGPHKDQKYDKRPELGFGAETKPQTQKNDNVIYYWQYPKVLNTEYCDSLIDLYGTAATEDAGIGDNITGVINKKIRNVKKIMLPIHEGIGAHLIGNAFVANQQAWQFSVTECQQVEYLKYDESGRYKSHIDTFLTNPVSNSRKLTALAFLNDDFEGGRFYLQIADEKIYPEQSKGTIIVFPSFLLHGVEDVTARTRHSVVCWILGPSFR
jgi:hypothetical protein